MDELAEREFRDYVAVRQTALFRAALLLTGHRQDAEDLLQTALTELAERWTEIAAKGSADAYVRKILYHQRVSWWRKRRHIQEYTAAVLPETAGGEFAVDVAQRLSLARALAELTPKQRAVIVLRYYEDLPEAEVAQIMGCTVGTPWRHNPTADA
jgi:RNA polymerase sigma-70 factor (sigma-E family)